MNAITSAFGVIWLSAIIVWAIAVLLRMPGISRLVATRVSGSALLFIFGALLLPNSESGLVVGMVHLLLSYSCSMAAVVVLVAPIVLMRSLRSFAAVLGGASVALLIASFLRPMSIITVAIVFGVAVAWHSRRK